ncbi:mercuric reductase [Tribonema minus]|uniref:Mercuric reductase n=1 Tax=Tribonema minus TaxID=303371 RepID=A0A836CF07_9STRA|nr:mercuric reductase [Tribonema minus]
MDIEALAQRLRNGVEVKDRKYHLTTYPKVFIGTDAVSFMLGDGTASSIEDAVDIGNIMMEAGAFQHVTKDHAFKNEPLFYRFAADEPDHGKKAALGDTGTAVSWRHLTQSLFPAGDGDTMQTDLSGIVNRDASFEATELAVGVSPLDEYNTTLLDNVHPPAWIDPPGDGTYNLVVLGAGSGGLVSAAGAAGVGAKVAIIESHLMGGDCLNVGCVPSKALIKAATVAHTVNNCQEYGISIEGTVKVDFGKVMERMRRLRAGISHHDSAERFATELGIDVFIGRGTFTGPNTIAVNGKTLTFRKAVVASGGCASLPPITGLKEAPYLTNASIFNLTALPPRLLVLGGGPIGMELAQAMARFGAQVTVVLRGSKIMPKEDSDAADIVAAAMERDGVKFHYNLKFVRVEHTQADGEAFPTIRMIAEDKGTEVVFEAEALLVAAGRRPNVTNMGLEDAGIKFSPTDGIVVSDTLQTTNKAIYAVGDCCTKYQFTHVSDFMARLAIRNALFFGNGKFSNLLIPWATYTEPEVAHVGLYPRDLEAKGVGYQTFTRYFKDVDRAILEGETEGFVKVHVKEGTDKILGATIVGPNAGDMISEMSVAIQHKVGLASLGAVIHPYPTKAEAVRQAGDLYNKTRLTPMVKGLLSNLLKFQRA